MHTEMLSLNTNMVFRNHASAVTSFIHMIVENENKKIEYYKRANIFKEYS
jgi:hypothetical protein